jgi:hypothetical protein
VNSGIQVCAPLLPQLEKAAYWTEYLALFLADGYSLIGQNDKAVAWIRAAMNRGLINYPYLTKLDPLLEGVRKDPEFTKLMEQIHRRWQAVKI